jgi:hypothetical protein
VSFCFAFFISFSIGNFPAGDFLQQFFNVCEAKENQMVNTPPLKTIAPILTE